MGGHFWVKITQAFSLSRGRKVRGKMWRRISQSHLAITSAVPVAVGVELAQLLGT